MPANHLLPVLTRAAADLTRDVTVVDETGALRTSTIPCERALTVYVDQRELVTLMTLGAHPELLVLGFLRNQRLVQSAQQVHSITVDWEVGAAGVKTRSGIADFQARTAQRVVTTGCGQGSVFGGLMDDVDQIVLGPAALQQAELFAIVNTIRLHPSVYKLAGSVHGCALFQGSDMRLFVEDVGRHNAIDTIAGWMWMQADGPVPGTDKLLYTTGRLTSEMVIKAAQMGIPIVVSRSGITEMGLEVAHKLGLCAIGRATHTRFLCYSAHQRLILGNDSASAADNVAQDALR